MCSRGKRFGELLREKRLSCGLSLRAFCAEFGFDPGNLSKVERGLLPPPTGEKLDEIAGALGLEAGSDDWYDFYDVASTDRGLIPVHLLDDDELVRKLPIVFRSLREGKLNADELDKLIEIVRRS